MNDRIIGVARALRSERYQDAAAVFAAGSLIRGDGTAYSDLDLVVVYPALTCAYRESFIFQDYPVEAFVHDPETLEYFFVEIDRPSGVPALPQMIVEGVEIPTPNDVSLALKQRAAALIAAGPPALDTGTEQRWRYAVTDLLDDLRDARSHNERVGTGARLYEQLADYHLRRQGLWSARGKAIPRTLQRADPNLCARYCRSFDNLFKLGDADAVLQLAEELLQARGGRLFEGYRADAPPTWRKTPRKTDPLRDGDMIREWTRNAYIISTDRRRLDVDVIHGFLTRSYWAKDRPRARVAQSIEHSIPFGVYHGDAQVGFARVVTDFVVLAFLADVFVLEAHRGKGLGTWLVEVVRSLPELRSVRRWHLGTRDAHGLYRKFGFGEPEPGVYMDAVDPESDRRG